MLLNSCNQIFHPVSDYLYKSRILYSDEATINSHFDKTKFRVDENDLSHCNFLPPNKRAGPCKAVARLPLQAALTFELAIEPFLMKFCFICDKSIKRPSHLINIDTVEPSLRFLINNDIVIRCYYCDYLSHFGCVLKFQPDLLNLICNDLKQRIIPEATPIEFIFWSCIDCRGIVNFFYFLISFR